MADTRINAIFEHLARTGAGSRFDVLHSQDSISGNALAQLVERGYARGFIRTVHHLDRFTDARLTAWQSRGFGAAERVLCVSRLWRDRLRSQHGIEATVVNNGVDTDRFSARADSRDATVAQRLGIGAGPVILAVGGVEARKNTIALLQAFIDLRKHAPEAQLVIAGGASLLDHGDCHNFFRQVLAKSNLSVGPGQAVTLTGALPDQDMPALYRLATVLAMVSLREGFGLAALEALASGRPVVASRIAPFTEYLHDRVCVWADPQDPQSIARALKQAIANVEALPYPRAAAMLLRRFSWRTSARQHAAIYRRFIARRSDIRFRNVTAA